MSEKSRIAFLNDDGTLDFVFENSDHERVARWVMRWLDDPIDTCLVVVPPGVELPDGMRVAERVEPAII